MRIHSLLLPAFTVIGLWLSLSPARSASLVETNLALSGTATQSSDIDSAHGADKAIDGNTDGAWLSGSVTHTQQDDPGWWEVDLGGAKSIGRIHVWFRADCCQNRNDDLTYSVLDANRTEVWKQKYDGRPPINIAFDFVPPIQGQIVRVEGQSPRTT